MIKKELNIALIGYGKMGKAIEQMALARQHQITLHIDSENDWDKPADKLAECDVAIEFSTPEAASKNIRRCFELDLPVVSGTTGWHAELPSIARLCEQRKACLFYASNFSVGVNIFFALNRQLASMLKSMKGYTPRIIESHHVEKLDAPSGTAITLAGDIIGERDDLEKWVKAEDGEAMRSLPIKSYRIEEVCGTHVVLYESDIDTIEIKHSSHSRKGFAEGALMAAEWAWDKEGIFTMRDLLNI